MELFKNEKVINIICSLKEYLRVNSTTNNKIPKFVFICGEQILDDNGNLIDEKTLDKDNNIRYYIIEELKKIMNKESDAKNTNRVQCIISEYLYKDDKLIDILTFEEVLAEISEKIIIIVESPGTFCELGAFVVHDLFFSKVIVINENNPKFNNSFITRGPIKKLSNKCKENVILHEGKDKIKKCPNLKDMICKIGYDKMSFSPNKNPKKLKLKYLMYELLNIIELFQPLKCTEIELIYKELRNIKSYTIHNHNKHKITTFKKVIELMEDMEIINKTRGYYYISKNITCYNSMFKLKRKDFNAWRIKYLSKVYKYEPERMEVPYELVNIYEQ